jgi:hypothetical protein
MCVRILGFDFDTLHFMVNDVMMMSTCVIDFDLFENLVLSFFGGKLNTSCKKEKKGLDIYTF